MWTWEEDGVFHLICVWTHVYACYLYLLKGTYEYACRSQKSLSGIFNHSPLFSFRDKVLLCGTGWPGSYNANQASQNSQRATCPASWALELQAFATRWPTSFFEVGSYWAHWSARLAGQKVPGILCLLNTAINMLTNHTWFLCKI